MTVQSQLKTISKSLASLGKQLEKITAQVAKGEAAAKKPVKKAAVKKSAVKKTAAKKTAVKKTAVKKAAAKKAPAKKVASPKGVTVLDSVFAVIKSNRKGVTISQLKENTKLDARQLSNALYKLSKKGMIFAKTRGLYVKK